MDTAEMIEAIISHLIASADETGCDTVEKALAEIDHQLDYVKENIVPEDYE